MDIRYVNPFIESFASVMPQLGFGSVTKGNLSAKERELVSSGVIVVVGIVGSIKGNVVYVINMESAKKIASQMMMGMPVNELDDMAKSALSELTNMLTANAATFFSQLDIPIDISTPTLLHGENVSVEMSSNKVLCIQLLADGIPVDINISFEK
ncbi:chemotaxis protein CheX [Candidatus Galacturonibacter soehngenii]|uniref:Chemotaxis protein CheX n=1 Tax=Candidatus Galacturonatibacter soehngenii TaxID=2307010 RepID=A0A7V7UBT7_9FIRM|nr:chemotaxis protein CheX [Candidatus Galacturonibacter soehngenii]KAB1438120.1 chemotaxis protein CheX [Candidatus Galacturonibacter soehngenii]MBA4687166.1 chemotaxis protein CheX [Candidatus Galacturonibacter soehngenii]